MEQFTYDENNRLWYEQHGDYYLPCLTSSEEEPYIGVWGLRHLRYLKEYHKAIYNDLSDKSLFFKNQILYPVSLGDNRIQYVVAARLK